MRTLAALVAVAVFASAVSADAEEAAGMAAEVVKEQDGTQPEEAAEAAKEPGEDAEKVEVEEVDAGGEEVGAEPTGEREGEDATPVNLEGYHFFERYDTDKNGQLSPDELAQFLKEEVDTKLAATGNDDEEHEVQRVTDEADLKEYVSEFLAEGDADNDGQLSEEELLHMLAEKSQDEEAEDAEDAQHENEKDDATDEEASANDDAEESADAADVAASESDNAAGGVEAGSDDAAGSVEAGSE